METNFTGKGQHWEEFFDKFEKVVPRNSPVTDSNGNVIDLSSAMENAVEDDFPGLMDEIKAEIGRRHK